MKADYVHKDSRTLEEKPQVFTRWIDPTIEELKRENQELKKQNNILQTEKEQLNSLANSCQEEIRKLRADYGTKAQVERDLLLMQNKKYKEVIDKLEFIKNRAISGATQETINKLAIDFINSYLMEEVE